MKFPDSYCAFRPPRTAFSIPQSAFCTPQSFPLALIPQNAYVHDSTNMFTNS